MNQHLIATPLPVPPPPPPVVRGANPTGGGASEDNNSNLLGNLRGDNNAGGATPFIIKQEPPNGASGAPNAATTTLSSNQSEASIVNGIGISASELINQVSQNCGDRVFYSPYTPCFLSPPDTKATFMPEKTSWAKEGN